jgi:predicted dehydrogenase
LGFISSPELVMPPDHPTRRSVLAAGAAALSAASYRRVLGANERVGLGFIGYGLIGKRHVKTFKGHADANLAAIAEVHRGRLEEGAAAMGSNPAKYADFRRLLEDKNVDAVVVSTPDHWHALMTMLACHAGKDAYVEKPMTLFVREGRWMADVARRTGRIVQVGTQQRSGKHYQRARQLLAADHIGRVLSVRMEDARNVYPGFGAAPDAPAPPELDWNLWLGPAPMCPYNPRRALYHFRWFWDYSGGQMTNLGAHLLDIVDWTIGLHTLRSAYSVGGRFALDAGGETPDTQDALFDLGAFTASWSMREASDGAAAGFPLTFHGTRGSLGVSRSGFQVVADNDLPPTNLIPSAGSHPAGGPPSMPVPKPAPLRTEPLEDKTGSSEEQYQLHARDFLDCIKTRRQPVSDVQSGHRTSIACHLANLSLRLGRAIRWDARTESVVGDAEAAGMLTRPYRSPWDKELAALGISV